MANYNFRSLVNVAKDLRNEKFSQIGEAIGQDTSTISNVLSGRNTSKPCEDSLLAYTKKELRKFAQALGIKEKSRVDAYVEKALEEHRTKTKK